MPDETIGPPDEDRAWDPEVVREHITISLADGQIVGTNDDANRLMTLSWTDMTPRLHRRRASREPRGFSMSLTREEGLVLDAFAQQPALKTSIQLSRACYTDGRLSPVFLGQLVDRGLLVPFLGRGRKIYYSGANSSDIEGAYAWVRREETEQTREIAFSLSLGRNGTGRAEGFTELVLDARARYGSIGDFHRTLGEGSELGRVSSWTEASSYLDSLTIEDLTSTRCQPPDWNLCLDFHVTPQRLLAPSQRFALPLIPTWNSGPGGGSSDRTLGSLLRASLDQGVSPSSYGLIERDNWVRAIQSALEYHEAEQGGPSHNGGLVEEFFSRQANEH